MALSRPLCLSTRILEFPMFVIQDIRVCRRNACAQGGGATFAVCLMLWVLDWVSAYDQSAWAKVISYLSVVTHFEPFSKGVIDSKDVVFYLSMIFFGLFLTSRSVESLRWRS